MTDDTHLHNGPATGLAVRPVDLRDYVTFDEDEACRVRVFATPRLALDLWCIQPGQATPVLQHDDCDVVYTVVGGRSWFVTDEGEIGLDPMGAMRVDAGVIHGIDNRAPDPLIVLAASAPPGDEPPSPPVTNEALAVRHDPDGPGRLRLAWEALLGVGSSPRGRRS